MPDEDKPKNKPIADDVALGVASAALSLNAIILAELIRKKITSQSEAEELIDHAILLFEQTGLPDEQAKIAHATLQSVLVMIKATSEKPTGS